MKKLAVITGANRGLGRSLVQEFSASGWNVIAITRSPEVLKAGAGSTDVVKVQLDVRFEPGTELAEALNGRPVDLLINNAVQGAPHAELGTIRADGVLNAVDVNVAGPLRLVQFLLPNLLEAPDPIIINVSSRLGSLAAQANRDFSGLSTSYAYKISKAAQNMLTVSLAQDLHGRIRCWAVHPGKLATAMGQTDASKDPRSAARQMRELVDSGDRASPRFCSLGEQDLHWQQHKESALISVPQGIGFRAMLSATNGLLAMEKDAVTGTPTLHLMVWPPGGGKTTPLREPNIGRCAPTYSG